MFKKEGIVLHEQDMKRLMRGMGSLIIASLQTDNIRNIFENLIDHFEKMIGEIGKDEAFKLLQNLADGKNLDNRSKACESLICLNQELSKFSFNQIKKILIGNFEPFIALAYTKLHKSVYEEENQNLLQGLDSSLSIEKAG